MMSHGKRNTVMIGHFGFVYLSGWAVLMKASFRFSEIANILDK